MNISVFQGDFMFDFFNIGQVIILMVCNVFDFFIGINIFNLCCYLNEIIVFIDGFGVYGFDEFWVNWLWSFEKGKLKVFFGNFLFFNIFNGEYDVFIDLNMLYMDNFVGLIEKVFVCGDFCVGENLLLFVFYVFFVREYNWLCDELVQEYLDWNDEQFYQYVCKLVGGLIQFIVYDEWLFVMGV